MANRFIQLPRETLTSTTEPREDALEKVREHLDVVPTLPSCRTPEELAEPVAAEDEYVTLSDSGPPKTREAALNECPTDPGATLRGVYREVVDVAAATVVTTESGAHQEVASQGDPAETGVSLQKMLERCGRVRAQVDALGARPQIEDAVDVLEFEALVSDTHPIRLALSPNEYQTEARTHSTMGNLIEGT
jgi:hypothetical protein